MNKNLQLAGMALIMLALSCRSSKYSSWQKAQIDIKGRTDLNSELIQENQFLRTASLSDSTGEFYQLTIFPVDSFKFSLQNGFAGKASKVVLNGSVKQQLRISDTSKINKTMTYQAEASRSSDLTERNKSREAALERTGIMSKGLALGLFVLLIILGLLWKLRQHTRTLR
ncbi:MAG: hypothetical protein ACO1NS_12665 [Daejeonella sp.]